MIFIIGRIMDKFIKIVILGSVIAFLKILLSVDKETLLRFLELLIITLGSTTIIVSSFVLIFRKKKE